MIVQEHLFLDLVTTVIFLLLCVSYISPSWFLITWIRMGINKREEGEEGEKIRRRRFRRRRRRDRRRRTRRKKRKEKDGKDREEE